MVNPRFSEWAKIASPISLSTNELVVTKVIGAGAFGEVSLAEYTGADPVIKNFGTTIVVKKFTNLQAPLDNDIAISPYLHAVTKNNSVLRNKINSGVAILDDEGHQQLISQFVAYDDGPPSSSGDLGKFLTEANVNCDPEFSSLPSFDNENIGITIAQFSVAIHESVSALHDVGVFHFDTAIRNFLVDKPDYDEHGNILKFNLKVSDFGLSQVIPAGGVVELTEGNFPIKWIDSRALNGNGHSIATDLYATRISMLETIGMALGMSHYDIMHHIIAFSPEHNLQDFISIKANLEQPDNDSLQFFVANAENLARNHPDVERGEQINMFLNCYREYLTQMPAGCKMEGAYTDDEMDAICVEDKRKFNEATQLYAQTMSAMLADSPQYGVLQKRLNLLGMQPANNIGDEFIASIKTVHQHILEDITRLPDYTNFNEEQYNNLLEKLSLLSNVRELADIHAEIKNEWLSFDRLEEIHHYIVNHYKQLFEKNEQKILQDQASLQTLLSNGDHSDVIRFESSLNRYQHTMQELLQKINKLSLTEEQHHANNHAVFFHNDVLEQSQVKPVSRAAESISLPKKEKFFSLSEKLHMVKDIVNHKEFWNEQAKLRVTGVRLLREILAPINLADLNDDDQKKLWNKITTIINMRLTKGYDTHRSTITTNFYKAVKNNDGASLKVLENFIHKQTASEKMNMSPSGRRHS